MPFYAIFRLGFLFQGEVVAMRPVLRSFALAPRTLILYSMAFCAVLAWATLWVALDQPWLGITLRSDDEARVIVAAVDSHGPAAGRLKSGAELKAAHGGDEWIAITPRMLMEEPDFVDTYGEYNAFLAEQDRLYRILLAPSVTLITDDGSVELSPSDRPIRALPFVFWFQILCGLIAVITGFAIYAFRRESHAARAYALTGIAFVLITFSAAIYSSREVALGFELFRALSVLNHFGSMLFAGAFVGLLWLYPTRLSNKPLPSLIVVTYLALWVADLLQWAPNLDLGLRIPIIAGLLLSIVLAVLQWRRSRRQAIDRAALKWFLFSLYLGGATFVAMMFVTVWLGLPPPLSQGYAFGIVTAMYLGVALGISRYRLFDLERWWWNIWLWLFAGVAIIGTDVVLAYLLNVSHSVALALSLALIGWLYFPARQWLIERLMPRREPRVESFLPSLLQLGFLSGNTDALQHGWLSLLREIFNPLEIVEHSVAIEAVAVAEDGQALELPGLHEGRGLRLRFRSAGRALFAKKDVLLAQALLRLGQQAVENQLAYQNGINAERNRLASDLHDDVASRLLTLVHRTEDPTLGNLARSALHDLRAVVNNLSGVPGPAREAIADWHAEIEQRCEASGTSLLWDDTEVSVSSWLTAHERLNLQRVLREATSNALRHSKSNKIRLTFRCDDNSFAFELEDFGAPTSVDWLPGRGLANMRTRVEELGGRLVISSGAGGVRVSVHIAPASGGPRLRGDPATFETFTR